MFSLSHDAIGKLANVIENENPRTNNYFFVFEWLKINSISQVQVTKLISVNSEWNSNSSIEIEKPDSDFFEELPTM